VSWKRQDDSGAFQNFSGNGFEPMELSCNSHRPTPAGAQRGIMRKTSDACSAADLLKEYDFTSPSSIPMQDGEVGHAVAAKGTLGYSRERQLRGGGRLLVRFDGRSRPGRAGR